jgi:hypothetical protein
MNKICPILWLAILSGCPCFAQTSIVGIRTPTQVIVSSDSLVSHSANTPETACKIFMLGRKKAFALARLAEIHALNFSAPRLALQAAKAGGTVMETEASFRELVTPQLTSVLQDMKDQAPSSFANFSGIALETLFFGTDRSVPQLIRTTYRPAVGENGKVTISTHQAECPGNCANGSALLAIGEQASIVAKLNGTSFKFPSDEDAQATLERWVQWEIDGESDIVGPPIATIRIDASGVTWLRPGKCNSAAKAY